MKRKTANKNLVDVARLYTDLFSDGTYQENKKFVHGVFETLKLQLSECVPGQRVTIVGFGSFEVRPPKKMSGSFKHYKTGMTVSKVQEYPRLVFTPSLQIKKLMRVKHGKRRKEVAEDIVEFNI